MSPKIDELLENLKNARNDLTSVKEGMKTRLTAFQESAEWVQLQSARTAYEQEIFKLETQIDEVMLAAYAVDKNKHPHPKIEIKTFKVVKLVTDKLGNLKEWCFLNFRPGLNLNESKCVEAAKSGDLPQEFYTAYDEPRVQIASKL